MRWITLFALAASLVSFLRGADATAPVTPAADATEPETKLEGIVIERADGFMTLTMAGPKVVLRFFNLEKKPIAPDVHHAIVKFRLSSRRPENRMLVLGADGMSLTHGRPLRAPFVFKAFIGLVKEAGGGAMADDDDNAEVSSAERYEVDFP